MIIRNKNSLGKWVKTMVASEEHKRLKKLAIDMNISLAELLRKVIKGFLQK